MTVQDASNDLFAWFEQHDNFEIGRDLRKIVPIMDDEESTNIAFKIALEKLEELNLLCSKDYADKKYYILDKPMDAYQQSIDLGPWTAKFIAGEINEFCALLEDQTDVCSASNIQEKDVRNLVHVVHWYKQKIMEKEQIISGISGGGEIDLSAALLDALGNTNEKLSEDEDNHGDDNNDEEKKKGKKKK